METKRPSQSINLNNKTALAAINQTQPCSDANQRASAMFPIEMAVTCPRSAPLPILGATIAVTSADLRAAREGLSRLSHTFTCNVMMYHSSASSVFLEGFLPNPSSCLFSTFCCQSNSATENVSWKPPKLRTVIRFLESNASCLCSFKNCRAHEIINHQGGEAGPAGRYLSCCAPGTVFQVPPR